MKRLKIVQLTNEFSTNGGVGSYLLRLCPALEKAGLENYVIHSDPQVADLSLGVIKHFFINEYHKYQSRNESEKSAACVIKILDSIKPDFVHIQGNNNFVLEEEIRKSFHTVKSFHVYDFCPSGNKFHHALEKPCEHPTSAMCIARMGYKRCTLSKRPTVIWQHYKRAVDANKNNAEYKKLIVASEYVKLQAIASGYLPTQIEVIPYFTPLPELEGSTFDQKTILFTGRVVKEKGLDKLLHALTLVRSEWRLIVDGDGSDLNNAKQLAQKLGLTHRIEFVGWADKERHLQHYRQASLIVVPSVWPEPFGLVGIEAMSYAKPVIAFRVGGIPQWLDDKVTGFLIEPYDVKMMADQIDYLLTHKPEAQTLGSNGRSKVEKEFIAERHVERLLNVYKQVMDVQPVYATNTF